MKGQEEPRVIGIPNKFQYYPCELPSSKVIDTSKLTVFYQFTYPINKVEDQITKFSDILCFQIGEKICKTYSHNLHLLDRNRTFKEKNDIRFRANYVPYVVISNYPEGEMTTENRIPYSSLIQEKVEIVTYTEPMPNIEWEIMEQTDTIGGYNCQVAQCLFKGREWKVWYTPEIPSAISVWKFSGLPGLILKAIDSTGNYLFEATDIQKKETPIELYDWHPNKKTLKEWYKLEEDMHQHPGRYFLKGGELSVYDKRTKMQPEEWKAFYDPIEKE